MERNTNKLYRPFLVLMATLLLGISMSFGQDQITELDEIEITASSIKKFGVGANVTELDSALIENYAQSSLAAILNVQSSAYIKQYGAGMLSAISIRGTGAGHTVVRWNGLQVGYPFLGQSDLSLLPLDFTNEISLVHGSASARYGTGAIGGIINLKSLKPAKGFSTTLNQSIGSFGATNSTIMVSTSGTKGYTKVGGFYNQSENDFPYKSISGKELGTQENASYTMKGVQIESALFINSKNTLTLNLQSVNADRNLQPSLGSSAANNQKDNNLWGSIVYNHKLTFGALKAQYGYLYDQIDYNGSTTDSKQHKGELIFENDFGARLSTEIGVNSTWVEVHTPFYEDSLATEHRSNIYASLLWHLSNRLDASFNFRQAFVTGYSIPFTPSVGLDYRALKKNSWILNVKGQLAKGYKVPTLNDRYWVPGGNLNLEPEESVNAEVGLYLKNSSTLPFWVSVTSYKLWVNNWILWLPSGAIWSPENKRKVEGFGIELETGIENNIGQAVLKGWLNYAYTKSMNQEAQDQYDRSVGKQLPYVPFHNGNITAQLNVKNWNFQLNGAATGKRFITSDNETEVPGYALLNIRAGYSFSFEQWNLQTYLNANNVTNTNYQSIINKAMPGINFLAGVKINFNK